MMNSDNSRVLAVLDRLSQPAAPFHENRVADQIHGLFTRFLQNPRVHSRTDRYGNIVWEYRNAPPEKTVCMAMASHMDHPGFDLVESADNRVKAIILGGLFRTDELLGSRVLILAGESEYRGTVTSFADDEHAAVWIECDDTPPQDLDGVFGVPDVERFRVEHPLVRGRAMDDLVGCAIQIAAFERIVTAGLPLDVLAVFHRAEEVGFLGAIGGCELKTIPDHAIAFSLEASKNLDGARPGDGIIIRTGDRMFMFDGNVENLLDTAAETLRNAGVKTQKRRMDGGACEASCFVAFGYETGAIAVPLINYHNQGDGRVDAEAVHMDDLEAGVELMVQTARVLADVKRFSRSVVARKLQSSFLEKQQRLRETGTDNRED